MYSGFGQTNTEVQSSFGALAYPYPVTYQQPDASFIELSLFGDRAVNWAQTIDGYRLLKATDGGYYYAVSDMNQGMVQSSVLAHAVEKRTASEKAFIASLNKGVFFSHEIIREKRESYLPNKLKSGTINTGFPAYGKRKLVVILVEYQDVKFDKSKEDFNNLFNQKNYSENDATGSVSDYFHDNSFGKMDLSIEVAGPYTLSGNRDSYGGNTESGSDQNPRGMAKEGVTRADKDVDFTQFDNDEDGFVDGVYIIFAGHGEEAGASSDAIWSHAWNFGTSPLWVDGIQARGYSCSPELMGNGGKSMTGIGVICHEFLHVCGLPDFYDTDYSGSGGQSFDPGKWDPMAGGSWNNHGKTPPFVNAYSREILGWQEPTVLSDPESVTLVNSAENNIAYKILTSSEKEFFVLENRQNIKWDTYIPSHGMLIYHVDLNKWNGNQINVDPSHQGFDIEEADGINTKGSYDGDPFPGVGMKDEFSDGTKPSSLLWSGGSTAQPITNISEDVASGIIFFDFNGGDSKRITDFSLSQIGPDEIHLSWNNADQKELVLAIADEPIVKNFPMHDSLVSQLEGIATIIYEGHGEEIDLDLSENSLKYINLWVKQDDAYLFCDYTQFKQNKEQTLSIPYEENFDTKESISDWGIFNEWGVNWQTWQWGTHYKGFDDSNNYFFFDSESYGSTGEHNSILLSPVFDITSLQTDSLIVAFDQIYRHYSTSQISFSYSSDKGENWTPLQDWQSNSGTSGSPEKVWFDISSVLSSPTVSFKWVFSGADSYYWMIDNLSLSSECPVEATDPDIPTGIEDIEDTYLSIYPIPCQDILYVEVSEKSLANLYSVSGRKVSDFVINPEENGLNLSDVPSGIYILRIENSQGIYSRKIIVR